MFMAVQTTESDRTAKMDGNLVILHPFENCFSYIKIMEGDNDRLSAIESCLPLEELLPRPSAM